MLEKSTGESLTKESKSFCLEDFSYDYNIEQIAQNPLIVKEEANLLVFEKNLSYQHSKVKNLIEILPKNTLILANNSKVFASRLHGSTSKKLRVEVFPLSIPTSEDQWVKALARPKKKILGKDLVFFPSGLIAEVQNHFDEEWINIRFNLSGEKLHNWFCEHGEIPLPPYIQREGLGLNKNSKDFTNYQNVYAEALGSVACPTAGLHFSGNFLEELRRSFDVKYITLHVGGGTFLPVRDLDTHKMHEENFMISSDTLREILKAKKEERNILCVGTTTFRCLESLVKIADGKDLQSFADKWLSTDLFIYPKKEEDRYIPTFCDFLMTNFHQPRSTLFMLICALIGLGEAKKLYSYALENSFRLFSYGDASLLSLSEKNLFRRF